MPRPHLPTLLAALTLAAPASAQLDKPTREFTGCKGPVRNVAFSPDGKTLAAGVCADEVRLYDVKTARQALLLANGKGWSIAAAFAPDGKSIVTTSWTDGTLSLWDLPGGKKRLTLSRDPGTGVHHVAFSPDGKLIVSCGHEARVWDAATGKLVRILGSHKAGICTAVFSPDGRRLAVSDCAGGVYLWEVGSKERWRPWAPGGIVTGLAFSPDGTRLYCGAHDGRVHECLCASGKTTRTWATERGAARTLSLSPDGRSLAVSTSQGYAQVWELATLKRRRNFKAHHDWAWGVAFAPDGNSIATAGDDAAVRLWDVTAGWAEPDADKKKERTDAQLEACWKDLGGEGGAAFTAVLALSAHGKQSVPFLAKQLKGIKTVTAEQITNLIIDLDDDEFETRQKASKMLAEVGEMARRPLEKAIQNSASVEQKRRAVKILAQMPKGAFSADQLRQIRAAEVLGRVGSAEARKLLATLPKFATME